MGSIVGQLIVNSAANKGDFYSVNSNGLEARLWQRPGWFHPRRKNHDYTI